MSTVYGWEELSDWLTRVTISFRSLRKQTRSSLDSGADACDVRFTAETALQNIMSGPEFAYPSITWPGQNELMLQFRVARIFKTGYQPGDTLKLYAIMPWNLDSLGGYLSWSKECGGWGGGSPTEVKLFEEDDIVRLSNHPEITDKANGCVILEPSLIDNQLLNLTALGWTLPTADTNWSVASGMPSHNPANNDPAADPTSDTLYINLANGYNANRDATTGPILNTVYLLKISMSAWSAGSDLLAAFYKPVGPVVGTGDEEFCNIPQSEYSPTNKIFYGCAIRSNADRNVLALIDVGGGNVMDIDGLELFAMPGILVVTEDTLTEGLITDTSVLLERIGK